MVNDDDLANLKNLSIAQLRRLWRERVGKKDPPRVKSLLLRELAWRRQQATQGGMDSATRKLLRAAVRRAAAGPGRSAGTARSSSRARPWSKPDLPTGARLVRTWRGVTHEVLVLEDGQRFEYRGKRYRSLSRIARTITGAHWSGPRFFGLRRVRAIR